MKKIFLTHITSALTFIVALTLITTISCDVVKQVTSAYNMVNCKYEYSSISNLSIAGIDISKGIQLTQIPRVTAILTGKSLSIPLKFNLILNVQNPNDKDASLNGLEYILQIDGIEFTRGSIDTKVNIPAGGRSQLPLGLEFDLSTLLKGESGEAVLNIAKNIIGINDKQSNFSLQIKPTILIGNYPMKSSSYIPVNFSFGGKK